MTSFMATVFLLKVPAATIQHNRITTGQQQLPRTARPTIANLGRQTGYQHKFKEKTIRLPLNQPAKGIYQVIISPNEKH
jgi:hypothetical protein